MIACLDGNQIASRLAYKLSDAFFVFPITPSTAASEKVEALRTSKVTNVRNVVPVVEQTQSELGSIAGCHGAAHADALPATFTSSQGLLLMIPNLIKMAGERRPTVVHVAARSVATHTLSIYGDHTDIQQIIGTGCVVIGSANQQEVQFNTILSHFAAEVLKVPVIHFYDGFITSHEAATVKVIRDDDLVELYKQFKKRYPNATGHSLKTIPGSIGLVANDDIHMQMTIAAKQDAAGWCDVISDIGVFLTEQFRALGLEPLKMNELVNPAAEHLIITTGSSCDQAAAYAKQDTSTAVLKLNTIRPFPSMQLQSEIQQMKNLKTITVLDRAEDQCADRFLYRDVSAALINSKKRVKFFSGVYGLSGKEVTEGHMAAVVANAKSNGIQSFSLGVNDDVTGCSLKEETFTDQMKMKQIKLFGYGSEGFVTAAQKIAEKSTQFVQKMSYFDARKSGGVTESDVRLSDQPARKHYKIRQADVVFVSSGRLFARRDIGGCIKPSGTVVIGDNWPLPKEQIQKLKEASAKIYKFDSVALQKETGISGKMNIFIAKTVADLAGVGGDFSKDLMAFAGKKTAQQMEKEIEALALTKKYLKKVNIGDLQEASSGSIDEAQFEEQTPTINKLIQSGLGKDIPVSAFSTIVKNPMYENDTTHQEKHDQAVTVPQYIPDKCIQCGKCAIVCPHGCIRAYVINAQEATKMGLNPNELKAVGSDLFLISISTKDCTGCNLCATTCPTKALVMRPNVSGSDSLYKMAEQIAAQPGYQERIPKTRSVTSRALQFQDPALKFHSACAGCGEVGYISALLRVIKDPQIVQGTGCPLVYLGQAHSQPIAASAFWTNSLFEDGNEVGLGLQAMTNKSTWVVQGDGAAYDIDVAGLLKNITSDRAIKMLVLDNQSYANTGGQRSGASFPGSSLKLATDVVQQRKDIVKIAIAANPRCYVATVAGVTDRTLQVLKEAESYPGPAIVIANSPCIQHSPNVSAEQANLMAVETGVFPLIRFDPRRGFAVESKKVRPVTELAENRIKDYGILQKWADLKWEEYQKMK